MKLDSKYFDMIRVGKRGSAAEQPSTRAPMCQWRGCEHKGEFRAPRGRGREGEFLLFCETHVRDYNARYNYFDGMSDAEVEEFQKDALTGHRPTWKVGANSWAHGTRAATSPAEQARFAEARTSGAEAFKTWRSKQQRDETVEPRRGLKPLERRAIETLELPLTAGKAEIKARFKALVKRHHPDLNGGDKAAEDKLREIIQAYNYLKQAGLV